MQRLTHLTLLQALKRLKENTDGRLNALEMINAQLILDFNREFRPHREDLINLLTTAVRDGLVTADAAGSVTRYAITLWGIEWLEQYGSE